LLGHVAELHDEVLGQSGTADTLRRQLLEANGSVETWKKTLAQAETRFAEALAQQERSQAQLSAERDLLLGHIAELHAEVLGQTGTADTLRRQLLEANGSVETWKKTLAKAETRFAEALAQQERSQAQLNAERDLLLGHIAELQRETEAKEQQLRDRAEDIARLTAERAALRESGDRQRRDMADDMTRKLHAARQTVARQETELTELSAELAKLRQDGAQQRQVQSDEMVRRIQNAQSEAETARQTVAELESALASLTAQNAHHAAQAAALAKELDSARDHWDGILKQAEQRELALRQSLEDLSKEYGKLLASRSWKITEPLRAANTLLGRTKHKEH
ncbi:hypothetical protein, partial [Salipiger abyssi]|uniref:hypothetical protein n=1 Tax=Salipiger abyssi TaxID=1250539 RepID=UPI00405A3200